MNLTITGLRRRRVRSNTQFGICNFQDTYKGKLMDERKDGSDMLISIKGHSGLWDEEDRKCLILKISASGKNEDITNVF